MSPLIPTRPSSKHQHYHYHHHWSGGSNNTNNTNNNNHGGGSRTTASSSTTAPSPSSSSRRYTQPSHSSSTTTNSSSRQQQQSKATTKTPPPTRSARRIKNGKISMGTDVTHIVRVTVLGLAGITVSKHKCRSKKKKSHRHRHHHRHDSTTSDSRDTKEADVVLPARPEHMKAVVGFSRNNVLRGTTALSKPLAKSPSEDYVHTRRSIQDHNVPPPPQRHVAVWATENTKTEPARLGSTVTFEANLHRSTNTGKNNNNDCDAQSIASSAFAPQCFEMVICLAEDGGGGGGKDDAGDNKKSSSAKVALPFGIATLAISGDECKHGRRMKMDLPILSVTQAKPLKHSDDGGGVGEEINHKNKNGSLVLTTADDHRHPYPMIVIDSSSSSSSPNAAATDGCSDTDSLLHGGGKQKKRTKLQKFFKRGDKSGGASHGASNNNIIKPPSSQARRAFAAAYQMDPTGDAIVRIALQVYEKGSAMERHFQLQDSMSFSTNSSLSSSVLMASSSPTKSPRARSIGSSQPPTISEKKEYKHFDQHEDDETTDHDADDVDDDDDDDDEETKGNTVDDANSSLLTGSYFSLSIDGEGGGTATTTTRRSRTCSSQYTSSSEQDTFQSGDGTNSMLQEDESMTYDEGDTTYCGGTTDGEDDGGGETDQDTDGGTATDDDYTLSFEPKPAAPSAKNRSSGLCASLDEDDDDDDTNVELPSRQIQFFGRIIQVPSCGVGSTSTKRRDEEEEDGTTISGRAKSTRQMFDDMTAVTADFFGGSYHVPLCRGIVDKDDDTVTDDDDDTDNEKKDDLKYNKKQRPARARGQKQKRKMKKPTTLFARTQAGDIKRITMVKTLSTLSDGSATRRSIKEHFKDGAVLREFHEQKKAAETRVVITASPKVQDSKRPPSPETPESKPNRYTILHYHDPASSMVTKEMEGEEIALQGKTDAVPAPPSFQVTTSSPKNENKKTDSDATVVVVDQQQQQSNNGNEQLKALSTDLNGTTRDSDSAASPKGVTDAFDHPSVTTPRGTQFVHSCVGGAAAPAATPEPARKEKHTSALSGAFGDFFKWSNAPDLTAALRYADYHQDDTVPVVVGADGEDASSIGSLTLNTHEININKEAQFKEMLAQQRGARTATSPTTVGATTENAYQGSKPKLSFFEILGSSALCQCGTGTGGGVIGNAGGGADGIVDDEPGTTPLHKMPVTENYFSEYDDFSLNPVGLGVDNNNNNPKTAIHGPIISPTSQQQSSIRVRSSATKSGLYSAALPSYNGSR